MNPDWPLPHLAPRLFSARIARLAPPFRFLRALGFDLFSAFSSASPRLRGESGLGLGLMGYPMARNLLRAGHQVALWSHNSDKARQLAAAERGTFCQTPREVASQADCMFLCVGDTAMSREVILGAEGLIEGVRAGSVVADASTISPSESRRIGEALQAKGVDFLDAPCTGSTPGAEGGTLTFMVGALGVR